MDGCSNFKQPPWRLPVQQPALLECATRIAGAIAALSLALIPYFTGQIIDFATIDQDEHAFTVTILKLLAASLSCAIFTGVRGGLFTVGITRLNVRLRIRWCRLIHGRSMPESPTARQTPRPVQTGCVDAVTRTVIALAAGVLACSSWCQSGSRTFSSG